MTWTRIGAIIESSSSTGRKISDQKETVNDVSMIDFDISKNSEKTDF